MHHFLSTDVVLGDRYYGSFFLIAALMEKGVEGVFPLHNARDSDFRRGQRLGKKDHLVSWKKPPRPAWMDQPSYEAFADQITVREVAVQPDSRGLRTKSRVYEQLLNAIAYQTVGNRPGRHEPRRVKRRPKPYPRLVKPRHLYQKKAA